MLGIFCLFIVVLLCYLVKDIFECITDTVSILMDAGPNCKGRAEKEIIVRSCRGGDVFVYLFE